LIALFGALNIVLANDLDILMANNLANVHERHTKRMLKSGRKASRASLIDNGFGGFAFVEGFA
jgi:hypothetical protein